MPTGPGAPNLSGLPGFSAASGIQAGGTGLTTGATVATPLNAYVNEVSTSTTNAGVMLPPGNAGLRVTVINDTANTITVYGYIPSITTNSGIGDTIALHTSSTQAATTTGVAQAANTIADYVCFLPESGNTVGTGAANGANWKQFLTQ